jgi:hypothetical protein
MLADIPYLDKLILDKIWPYGFCTISAVKRTGSAGQYMAKEFIKQLASYVSKDIKEGSTKGFRRYYCSNSVLRPDVFYSTDARRLVIYCFSKHPVLLEQKEYLIEFQGYCTYTSYRLDLALLPAEIDKYVYFYG